MKKTTRLMSLIIAAALILSGCNQNNVVSHGIPDTNTSETTTTTTAASTSVTTSEAITTTSAAVSETEETTPATTVSIEETTVPVDAAIDVTEDTTTPAETTEITAEQAPVETTATTTSVTETTAVTTVSTTRATTTSTVILAYTSASVANKPEPAHIYIQEYDQLGQGLIYITGFNDDIQTGAYFIIETEDNLDYALKKAYKYWDDTYGNAYGEAQAKVIYYTGKTYLYTRNGGTTTATTTSASATSGTTIAKPVTTAVETTASTTARTTTASTTAKPQTSAVTSATTSTETTSALSDVPFIDDYKSKYLYNALNDAQKSWYEWRFLKSRYGIKGKEPHLDSEEKGVAILALQVSSIYTTDTEVNAIANKIVSKALKEDHSYAQIKVIHDELCDLVTARGGNNVMDDLFLTGKGSCWARADSFTYLCQLAGYDCFRVGGDVKDGDEWYGHEWNMIKVDGKWYYVDVTYDGAYGTTTKWFLKGEDTFSKDHRFEQVSNGNVYVHPITYIYPTVSKTDYNP